MLDLGQVRAAFSELKDVLPLGSGGGQKDVLRAKAGKRAVCLKLIKPSADDEGRSAREIEAVARLKSSYVPKVMAHGRRRIGGESRLFVIEELVDGDTLREKLRGRALGLKVSLAIADSLLRACSDFEAHKIVHRDLKPENLLIDASGKVWVIDFGIARLLDLESITKTAKHFGVFTAGYGAPEQIRNIKCEINVRCDLFSVGVVIYECIVGHNPYLRGKMTILDVIREMLSSDLPRIAISADANGELAEFIAALVARFPHRRPQTAKEALDWFTPIYMQLRSKF